MMKINEDGTITVEGDVYSYSYFDGKQTELCSIDDYTLDEILDRAGYRAKDFNTHKAYYGRFKITIQEIK